MRKRLRDVESHFGSVNAWKVREAWVPYSLTGFLWSNFGSAGDLQLNGLFPSLR